MEKIKEIIKTNLENETTTSTLSETAESEKMRLQKEREQRREEHIEKMKQLLLWTKTIKRPKADLEDIEIYKLHSQLLVACANKILEKHGKQFVVDDNNKDVLRFLLYYFNDSPLYSTVFPKRNYTLDKNILLIGGVGVGKTLLMDAFALYLKKTENEHEFLVSSQTQMLNHFKQHNNIDRYTFNTAESRFFDGNPCNICLNDIGLKTQKYYGNDTELIIEEFLFSRYEIWEQQGKSTHLTTNLDKKDMQQLFDDEHGRLKDRLKMYNVIPMEGNSRR